MVKLRLTMMQPKNVNRNCVYLQMQLFTVVLKKKRSEKFLKIYSKTIVPGSLFNKHASFLWIYFYLIKHFLTKTLIFSAV